MTEKLTLKRTDDGFDDNILKRVAAKLKAEHGILAAVPYQLHEFAGKKLAAEAKKISFGKPGTYMEAFRLARSLHPHLAFLSTCEFRHNPRECHVDIAEAADNE